MLQNHPVQHIGFSVTVAGFKIGDSFYDVFIKRWSDFNTMETKNRFMNTWEAMQESFNSVDKFEEGKQIQFK